MTSDQLTSPADAVTATNRHYDLPPEVFATFLGQRMKYTCGLYSGGAASLDEAQEAKLAYIARCLDLQAGSRLLDIGTGWGSLACYAAETYGCHVTAVTPSPIQAAFVRDRAAQHGLDSLIQVTETSVYTLTGGSHGFDAVAMVGVIEHMPDHRQAIAIVADQLRRGGRLYASASCYRSESAYSEFAERVGSRQVTHDVFGYGILRPFSHLVAAVEDAGLSLTRFTDLTGDYHRTIEDWISGVEDNRDSINAHAPGLADDLATYMRTTNTGWGYTTKHYALTAIRSRIGAEETPR